MNAILPIVLALSGAVVALPLADGPAPEAAPVVASVSGVVQGDWVDLALVLADPDVETRVVDVWEHGDEAVVTAVHRVGAGSEDCVWVGFYTFPSTIYAHSIVTVPFHADELE